MSDKHPASSKSMAHPSAAAAGGSPPLSEGERKKMELGDAMEHEHGQAREDTAKDIQEMDEAGKTRPKASH